MARNGKAADDKLIRDLYEKLNWFTFEASEEEFDGEQVRAILELLEKLDPLPEAEDAGAERQMNAGAGFAGAAVRSGGAAVTEPQMSAGAGFADAVVRSGENAGAERRMSVGSDISAGAGQKNTQGISDGVLDGRDGQGVSEGRSGSRDGQIGRKIPDDPEAAFERFKKRYNITDEDLARKDGKLEKEHHADGEKGHPSSFNEFSGEIALPGSSVREKPAKEGAEKDGKKGKRRGRFLNSAWGKAAAAVIVVAAAGTYLSFGTSAVQQKSFFEIVQDSVNSLKFTVTGNVMESEVETEAELEKVSGEAVYYASWEEAVSENEDILIPGYIPEGYELEEICKRENEKYTIYTGIYVNDDTADNLIVRIKEFDGNYTAMEYVSEDQWEAVERGDGTIRYYQTEELCKGFWMSGKCLYSVEGNDFNLIDEVIAQMKK